MAIASGDESTGFTEKGFYLGEFRGRTLAIAAPAAALRAVAPLESVLKELEANGSRVVLVSTERDALASLLGTPLVDAEPDRLEGVVGRALRASPRAGLVLDGSDFTRSACEVALRLGVWKLVWLEPGGGLVRPDGSRQSFMDLSELTALVRSGPARTPRRAALLREIEAAVRAGLREVNLCTPEGLGEELFTYAGSGTLFTRGRYVRVRKLGIDDFEPAHHLVARGVAEGYLAPRSPEETDRIFANGYGAFVEGQHLAGMGALLPHPAARAGEIASLYTLTRFLGEGIGGHLVAALRDTARARGNAFVFACTTSEQVARFFERTGFRRVAADELPSEKWESYDPARRPHVICLRCDLA
jgi:N-acetylglutamate synthase-like GNAT family acetyltransferase